MWPSDRGWVGELGRGSRVVDLCWRLRLQAGSQPIPRPIRHAGRQRHPCGETGRCRSKLRTGLCQDGAGESAGCNALSSMNSNQPLGRTAREEGAGQAISRSLTPAPRHPRTSGKLGKNEAIDDGVSLPAIEPNNGADGDQPSRRGGV